MCEKDYAHLLCEKVQAEYDDFIAEMKGKSADEIIESAYQIVINDEITVFCRDCSPKLTDRQFESLLSSNNTLHEVFEQWCKNGELQGLTDIGIALEEAADRILVSLGKKVVEVTDEHT